MITARQYEEKMIELSEEYKDKPETMKQLAEKLNIDVLECFGYGAGAEIYKKTLKDKYITLPRDKVKAICVALDGICSHECCDYGYTEAVDYADSLLIDVFS